MVKIMEMLWNGYKLVEFEFKGRAAKIVFPENADANKNWALKTEYWDAFPNTELELLKNGFHIAFLKNPSRFLSAEDHKLREEFCNYLCERYGLNEKCALIGMSLGGANAVAFAGQYPQRVSCMFIDAPVLNYYNFVGERFLKNGEDDPFAKEFHMTYPGYKRYMLLDFKEHPINYAKAAAENRIPVMMLYGTADDMVDYNENGILLEGVYEEYPGLLTIVPRENQGHHPHGLENPISIVEFILRNSK